MAASRSADARSASCNRRCARGLTQSSLKFLGTRREQRRADDDLGRYRRGGQHWTPDEKLVEVVYLAALSRRPTEDEKKKIVEVLGATPSDEKREAIEDLFWGVLSSKEFLFNR